MERVCTGFCDEIQKQFNHMAFTVVSTACKLGVGDTYVRCHLCGVPVQKPTDDVVDAVERDDKVAEARRMTMKFDDGTSSVVFMCYACCRLYYGAISEKKDDDVKTMKCFARTVTSFLHQQ